jgi:hypothetical protein
MKTSRRPASRSPFSLFNCRAVGVVVCLLTCLLAAAGCEDDEPSSESESARTDAATQSESQDKDSPEITYEDGDPPTDATVIARSGPLKVTFGEYQTFLQRTELFDPSRGLPGSSGKPSTNKRKNSGLSDRRKASPRLQIQTARNLLRSKVIEHLAQNYEVSISDRAIAQFLKDSQTLNVFLESSSSDAGLGALQATELPGDNTFDDLESIARERLRRRELRDTLLSQTNESTLWRWYRQRNNRSAIMYVRQLNVAASSKIDSFAASHQDEIRKHYDQHTQDYRVPRRVEIRELKPTDKMLADKSPEAIESLLKQAAQKLQQGEAPKDVAAALDLSLKPARKVGPRMHRKAHDMSIGEAGSRLDGPGAPHAWIVQEIHDSHPQKLDKSLKRQIASELLQKRGVVPSVKSRLNRALEVMQTAKSGSMGTLSTDARQQLEDALTDKGFDPKTTDLFTRDSQGYIPGIGIAKPVMELAFSLDGEKPVADTPVAARQHAYAVRLVDRQKPSRDTFEANVEKVRGEYTTEMRNRIVEAAVGEWYNKHKPELDLTPVRIVYGVLKNPKQ